MDLHFSDAAASEAEAAAVDSAVGPLDRGRRDLLLPALWAVQRRVGWISPGALNYLCKRLEVPPAEAYGVASFYALFSTEPQPPTVVHVCDDIACKCNGADALCAALEVRFGPSGSGIDGQAAWKRSPCLGLCERGGAAFVQCAGQQPEEYALDTPHAEEITAAMVSQPDCGRGPGKSVPQAGQPGRRLLARIGIVDPSSIDDYRAHGGYVALRHALELGPAGVIREVAEAKLTGRGGAAFPAGVKWKAVAEAPVRPRYVVCNADESEPGTFKDRVLMEEDPYAVVEALTIAGLACGAEKGFIYIRGEFPEATAALQHAIDTARTRGYLGEDVLGKGARFDIEIRRGAGAYICGEETALLNSIEGKRGEPRNKPPFPAQVGLFGKPTAINNVETLVNVLQILSRGGAEFAATGSGNSTGTRLFCLSGCVERPGVYELPYGATLRELLEMAGGVRGDGKLQAVLLGGAAGVFVRPDELDISLTLEGARAAGATLGSGVVMVFDETVDMRAILLRIAAFFRDESCGQCVPCRVGTVRQEEALARLCASVGSMGSEDVALLAELEQVMRDASICGLGQTAASAIHSAIHRLGVFGEVPAHG